MLAGLGGAAAFLVQKAHGQVVWQVDAAKCVNSRLGEVGVEVCDLCTTECVVSLSAVRAVNEFSKCGRCAICPAYFNITSAVDEQGLPSEKLCPRDAIERKPIGKVDPEDPANNFYEYVIDEAEVRRLRQVRHGLQGAPGAGFDRLEGALQPVRGLQPLRHLDGVSEGRSDPDAGRRGAQSGGDRAARLADLTPTESLPLGARSRGDPAARPDFRSAARPVRPSSTSVRSKRLPSRKTSAAATSRRRCRSRGRGTTGCKCWTSCCWRRPWGSRSGSSWGGAAGTGWSR